MPQNIVKSVKDLVAEASAKIKAVSVEEALALHNAREAMFVDIRDVREVAKSGRISGARHVPRGMLEFWIDPNSPYHKPFFAEDQLFIFYCAASWRSALSTAVAQEMGLAPVCHLDGGFNAWNEAGGPVEAPRED